METRVWCDVGGTFTDCILEVVNPKGTQRQRLKVLSSGQTPAKILAWESPRRFATDLRTSIENFWRLASVAFLDAQGNKVRSASVVSYSVDSGAIEIDVDLTSTVREQAVTIDLNAHLAAPVLACRLMLGCPLTEALLEPFEIRLGTTRGTNALLTRTGSRTAFITTDPFADLLLIGNQDRPNLFDLEVKKRVPLYERVVAVNERILTDGSIELAIVEDEVRSILATLKSEGIDSVAICLMNSYVNPTHELVLESIARQVGFENVSVSHRISPIAKLVDRSETAVIDAYLSPVIGEYLRRLHEQFGAHERTQLRVMTSAGGLVGYQHYSGKDSVLSGPAGGVVALQRLSNALATKQPAKLIGLDMGGTSTDVCRIAGKPEILFESMKADVRLLTPSLDIQTVASGGGSICSYDGVQWHVGPASAGALPGPACYGRGGPLTVTDLNLLTGRIPPAAMPFEVNVVAAKNSLLKLARCGDVDEESLDELAEGLRQIANEQMAAAVRSITIAQGAEPEGHILVGFGGAAGQHICEIADILGIETVLDPCDAGIMSAIGMGLAPIARTASHSIYQQANTCTDEGIENAFHELRSRLLEQISFEHLNEDRIEFVQTLEVRTKGTDRTLSVPWSDIANVILDFHKLHHKKYGYSRPEMNIELATANVVASIHPRTNWSTPTSKELQSISRIVSGEQTKQRERVSRPLSTSHCIYQGKRWHECVLYARTDLRHEEVIEGPAIVVSDSHTMVIDKGWIALVCNDGSLMVRRVKVQPSATNRDDSDFKLASTNSIVVRDVLAQRYAAIAYQMGLVLEQTAISVNIRDRRDFSCAIFDEKGFLIANAPHVPVHLGAMQTTVQFAIESFPEMVPGDSFITNDPQCGGSHLPDITVITPVFSPVDGRLAFFVANRAHHAEIGGIAPGSMAPNSRRLVEEGVIITMQYLTHGSRDCYQSIQALLEDSIYPSRLPVQNMADISAQGAANQRGVVALEDLLREVPWQQLTETTQSIFKATETKVRNWIATLAPYECFFADSLDDGTRISVKMTFYDQGLKIDFTGTGPVSLSNFNASLGIVQAAVLYVIRTLMTDSLPLNSGALRPVEIIVPNGLLNPEAQDLLEDKPAVAAGNVETSQRIVDVLLGALGVCGASQGTMNNFLIGDQTFGFYETLGGGTGATANSDGASAVHSHMTNTRLTDPEVLEQRYPVRLRQLAIRPQSGGKGQHRGGDGMIREIEFLKDLQVSIISSRRPRYEPYGQAGGDAGKSGRNYLIESNGDQQELPGCVQLNVSALQRIRIETPGGGGFGDPT